MPAGIFALSPDHARECLDRGFQFVALGSAAGFMIQGAASALERAGWRREQ